VRDLKIYRKKMTQTKVHTFQELIDRTNRVSEMFPKQYDERDCLIDLMEEVGELAQAIQISLGRKYSRDPLKQKTAADVADALGDILFEVLRIAELMDVNLAEEYSQVLDRLVMRLEAGEFDEEAQ